MKTTLATSRAKRRSQLLWSFLLLLSSFARVPRFFEDYSTRFGRKKREKKGIIFECEKGQDTLCIYILGTLPLLRVEH